MTEFEDATWEPVFSRNERTPVSESQVAARAEAEGSATPADFRAAGLSEQDAVGAARGLVEGTYFSFEHACASITAFDTLGRNLACTPSRVAEAAARVAQRTKSTPITEATFVDGVRVTKDGA